MQVSRPKFIGLVRAFQNLALVLRPGFGAKSPESTSPKVFGLDAKEFLMQLLFAGR